jgi:hypothetical protein
MTSKKTSRKRAKVRRPNHAFRRAVASKLAAAAEKTKSKTTVVRSAKAEAAYKMTPEERKQALSGSVDRSTTTWTDTLTEEDREEYFADFGAGSGVTFWLWPDETKDLTEAAIDAAVEQYGIYAATWTPHVIEARNGPALAVLPHPI